MPRPHSTMQHTAHTSHFIPCTCPLHSPLSLQGAPRPRHHRMRGAVLIRVGIVAAQGASEARDAAGEAALQLGEGGHRDGKRLHRAQRRAVVERKGVLAHAAEEDYAPLG